MAEEPHGPYVTQSGRVLTDADLIAMAAEAENGYDVGYCSVCGAGVLLSAGGTASRHNEPNTDLKCAGSGQPAEPADNVDDTEIPRRSITDIGSQQRRRAMTTAVKAPEGLKSLKTVVSSYLNDDIPVETLSEDLEQIRSLVSPDREDTVLDVMDFLNGWCAPSAKLRKVDPDT